MIFVRNPIPGTVKTRLAKSIGNQKALEVYHQLMAHTAAVSAAAEADCKVFYSTETVRGDVFDDNRFQKGVQHQGGLGERMESAFSEACLRYHKVVIIGSDCYDLDSERLNHAFEALEENDVVIGPAFDGGYYLIGMKQLHPELFRNKTWSTQSVLPDTIQSIVQLGKKYTLLPALRDIDHLSDLEKTDLFNA